MRTVAFTETYRLSINGKTFTGQVALASGKYYLVIKDPAKVFVLDGKTIGCEIALEDARSIGVI